MSDTVRFTDPMFLTYQHAYVEGEYHGYWGVPHKSGTHDNLEWVYYLRGYLAGVKTRNEEGSDAAAVAFAEALAEAVKGGERE